MLHVIAAAERLPGEIILLDWKIAGQPLDALAQHRDGIAGRHQLVILRRRDAERIERDGALGKKLDRFVVEQGRDIALEQAALLFRRARGEDGLELLAVQLGDGMENADEAPEQAVAIQVLAEHVDAPAAQGTILLPISPRLGVELGPQIFVVGRAVGLVVRMAEEAEERVVAGQVLERGELQLGQRDVIGIEVDGDDPCRIGRHVVQDVAAARSDGNQPVLRLEVQGRQVDDRILPDLVIDKPLKHKSKEPLQGASFGVRRLLMGRLVEKQICHGIPLDLPLAAGRVKGVPKIYDGLKEAGKEFRAGLGANGHLAPGPARLYGEPHDQDRQDAHRRGARPARPGEDRGEHLSRPKPGRPHAAGIRRPGAGPGPRCRQPHGGRPRLPLFPCLFPARRRSQDPDPL